MPTKKTVAEKEAKPAKPLKAPEPEEWIIDIPELLTALDLYARHSLSLSHTHHSARPAVRVFL